MKHFILFILIVLFSTTVYSQRTQGGSVGVIKVNWYKQGWFLDGNVGARFLGKTSSTAEMSTGLSMNGGIGYVFNEFIGAKGRLDYNGYKVSPGHLTNVSNKSHSISLSAEAVVKLLQLIGPTKARDYALNFHAGFGITSLFNPEYNRYVTNDLGRKLDDPFIKGADDMFHIVLGINPQFHLSSKVSVNLDLSHFIQFKQHRTYDTFNGIRADGVTGVMGITLGMTYRL